jgi:2-polyprenyl-6-methoxyphenol hydroxylase-like FAD-dependent oxidoreductase
VYVSYKSQALRITRGDVLRGLMGAAEKHPNIKIEFGKKTVKIDETSDSVTITFADGTSAKGDILLGCDGIHSVTRLLHVEPERKAVYSGITNAFGYAPVPKGLKVHFECASLNFCQRGMMLASFFEPTHTKVYIGGLMEMDEIKDRDGWTAYANEQAELKADVADRFKGTVLPALNPLLEAADDFYLWPVFTLSKEGKWATDRTMLLGDAAHAMPPQGESTGIVFEDTVLFARCLARWVDLGKQGTIKDAFNRYEALRRHRINVAYDESSKVVATVKDSGWLGHRIKMMIIPWFLWFSNSYRHEHFVEDVTTKDIGF